MKIPYVKIAGGVIVLAVICLLLWVIGPLFKLLIISALLAYILDPIATSLESTGLSRLAATAILFLAVALILFSFGLFAIPAVIRELQALQSGSSADQTGHVVAQLQALIAEKLSFIGLDKFDLAGTIERMKIDLSQRMLRFLVNDGVGLITHAVALPFIAFFLVKDGREMKSKLIRAMPNRYFEFALNLLAKMDQQLGFYLRGQFLDAAIFGILSTIALWILDVRYFLFIGVFAGLANLIPYVGPIAGACLATGVTIMTTGDFIRVGYVIAAFIIVKLVDDSIIQPMVVARSVDMHPLLVLLVVIIGGEFFGIIGMLLSVPATGFIKVVFHQSKIMLRRYKLTTTASMAE